LVSEWIRLKRGGDRHYGYFDAHGYQGVDVVGPIPQELQVYVSFAGAIRSQAAQPEGARELLKFIAEPNTALISG
jgi:hypothetical protein